MAIRVKLNPLEAKASFPHLRRTVTYNNSDWEELYSNMWKSQRRWGMVANVMGKMGALIKAQLMMYKAAVQVVILYGSEIWVVTDVVMTVL